MRQVDHLTMVSRTEAQNTASRTNGAASFGPTSLVGKQAASLNSVKHGLGSKTPLLLPGEDPDDWESFMGEWFATLAPISIPEGTIVAQLGDLAWKLERLARIEHGNALKKLEEAVMQTPTARTLVATQKVRVAVDGLLRAVNESQPPTSTDGLEPFLDGLGELYHYVKEIEGVPASLLAKMSNELKKLADSNDAGALTSAFLEIGKCARELASFLASEEERLNEEQKTQRERLSAEQLLTPDPEQRKFDRYRETIEKAMSREFGLLNQMREQRPDVPAGAGQDPQEVRVRLRLVK